jgi:hypothetical protein
MAKTITEAEVKRATAANNHTLRNAGPAYTEQPWGGKLLWILAPIALVGATGAAYLVVRRWLNNSDSDDRKI